MKPQKDITILSIYELFELIPTEEAATKYIEQRRWGAIRVCPHCRGTNTAECKNHKPMPYRCRECRNHFSVRTGSVLAESKVPLKKWLFAIYLITSARKGISSIQLAKEIGVTQKTAWFLDHRIREAYKQKGGLLGKKVEVDETYIGGKEANKHADKKLHAGRGGVGKMPVIGMVERNGEIRAFPIKGTTQIDLKGTIVENVAHGSIVYTDGHKSYENMKGYDHHSVNHSAGEYVRGDVHTNGIESFWALLKRGHYGIYHSMSKKHLHRYVNEFSARYNMGHDTFDLLHGTIKGMMGKRLTYKELKA